MPEKNGSVIQLPIRSLLGFYDEAPKSIRGHVSAVTGVIGENLGIGLLLDFFRRNNLSAEVLEDRVTQKTKSGKRLDKWVKVKSGKKIVHYQVEIKNWSAYAIGGRRLAVNATTAQVRAHKIERWTKEWDGNTFIKEQVRKVLTPMASPIDAVFVEPLVCYWDNMHPKGKDDAWFSIPVPSGKFPRVWVFSMSAHLRNLMNSGDEMIEIHAPDMHTRLTILNKLLGLSK